jgi:SAM-dependent methyltransferase
VTELLRFVLEALPAAPARVLEVGAGRGELAAALRAAGHEVVAIDPAADGAPGVERLALLDLPTPADRFDAAVAVFSLHHVEPLEASCRRLAEVVRPGGALVVDEFDIERFGEPEAAWWLARADHAHDEARTPRDVVRHIREHCHALPAVRAALAPWFDLDDGTRGPYLHRWSVPDGLRAAEEADIDAGRLQATGVRFTGTRR